MTIAEIIRFSEYIQYSPLFCGSPVCTCFLQGRFHFLNFNDAGIIVNGVGLPKAAKSFLHPLYTIEPVQGCLTNVISPYKKNHHGHIRVVCMRMPIYG